MANKKKETKSNKKTTIFSTVEAALRIEFSSEVGKVNVALFTLIIVLLIVCCVPSALAYVVDIFRILMISLLTLVRLDASALSISSFDRTSPSNMLIAIILAFIGFVVCLGFVYCHDKNTKNDNTKVKK